MGGGVHPGIHGLVTRRMDLPDQWRRHEPRLRAMAAEIALLFVALAGADRYFLSVALPAGAQLAVLALGAALVARPLPPAAAGPWRRYFARLPDLLIVGGGAAALLCYWLALPWPVLGFVPIWIGLELAYLVGWQGLWPVAAPRLGTPAGRAR